MASWWCLIRRWDPHMPPNQWWNDWKGEGSALPRSEPGSALFPVPGASVCGCTGDEELNLRDWLEPVASWAFICSNVALCKCNFIWSFSSQSWPVWPCGTRSPFSEGLALLHLFSLLIASASCIFLLVSDSFCVCFLHLCHHRWLEVFLK